MPFSISTDAFEAIAGIVTAIFLLRAFNVLGCFTAGLKKIHLVRNRKAFENQKH